MGHHSPLFFCSCSPYMTLQDNMPTFWKVFLINILFLFSVRRPKISTFFCSGSEIAPENRYRWPAGLCSRRDSRTGLAGRLKCCKPSTLLVTSGGGGGLPSFFSGLPRSETLESATGHSRPTSVTFMSYVIHFFLILALHHSLSWLDCTGKANYDNSICLMSDINPSIKYNSLS